jgi:hypothetical protein
MMVLVLIFGYGFAWVEQRDRHRARVKDAEDVYQNAKITRMQADANHRNAELTRKVAETPPAGRCGDLPVRAGYD